MKFLHCERQTNVEKTSIFCVNSKKKTQNKILIIFCYVSMLNIVCAPELSFYACLASNNNGYKTIIKHREKKNVN